MDNLQYLNERLKSVNLSRPAISEEQRRLMKSPEYIYDEQTMERCMNLLMDINGVERVLLDQLPALTQKYSHLINEIKATGVVLTLYKFKLPNVPALLESSKRNYHDFNAEKAAGCYANYTEAAGKLENSILISISKIQAVMDELGQDPLPS